MPSWGTLVFLCSCLPPFPCMLDFANVVDLLLEYMCPHMEVECALFEAETGSHDSCQSEAVDFALMVDMSLGLGDGYSHTCGSQHVSINFFIYLSYFSAEIGIVVQSVQRSTE